MTSCRKSTHLGPVHKLLPPANEAKVMFLQVSVCPHWERGHAWLLWQACMVAPGGAHMVALGGVCVVAPEGGMCGCSGGGAWLLWGACVVAPGGMHGCYQGGVCGCSGGHVWLLWGVCMVALRGMCGCSQGGMCGCSWGGMHVWLLPGGMCGCCWGACMVAPRGAHMVALGGCVWLLQRGACVVALGGCMVALGGMCCCSWGHAWLLSGGCVCLLRGHVWLLLGGMHVWLLPGGMCGCCWGACMVAPRGACMGYNEIWRYDQWAGGTHPTGMHSCFIKVVYEKFFLKFSQNFLSKTGLYFFIDNHYKSIYWLVRNESFSCRVQK